MVHEDRLDTHRAREGRSPTSVSLAPTQGASGIVASAIAPGVVHTE